MSQKSAIRIPAGSSSLPSGRGFTLIELLVVVAIIVLLVSILLPSLSNARTQAKRVQCASNVRQVVQSNLIYAQSENNILPGSAGTSQGVTGEWGNLVFFGPSQMVASGYLKSPIIRIGSPKSHHLPMILITGPGFPWLASLCRRAMCPESGEPTVITCTASPVLPEAGSRLPPMHPRILSLTGPPI